MADVLLRVKRKRDEPPAQIIAIEEESSTRLKKRKTLDTLMANLSLKPTALVFRLKNPKYTQRAETFMNPASAEQLKQANQTLQESNRKERVKAKRYKTRQTAMREKYYEVVLGENSWILNGKKCENYPGVAQNLESELVEDWYELTEVDACEADTAAYAVHFSEDEELDSSFEESIDSEDSNREDHPYNDYPDEDEFQSEDEEAYEYRPRARDYDYYIQSGSDSEDYSSF